MKRMGMAILALALLVVGCAPAAKAGSEKKVIVVTYSVLGSLVEDLAGDDFEVRVLMPNGLDVHEWEPSAKDIEALNKASIVVRNGLGLEGGMDEALAQAEAAGVPAFVAADHISIRTVKAGEGLPSGDPDQAEGAQDPHLWLAPAPMKAVVVALASDLKTRFGTDVSARAQDLVSRLDALDARIQTKLAAIPEAQRLLVTGHESLGYFAEAYGLTLVGAIIPSLTDQAEVSAADLAALKTAIQQKKAKVIFSELGTPPKVAQALSEETGLKVVEITTHTVPEDGSYFTFLESLADTIIGALAQ